MLPAFYPRAQFSGMLRWSCVYCANLNKDSVRPGTTWLKCGKCERHWFYGLAMHVPLNAASKMPKDHIIPSWADEEYPFDSIPQYLYESMTPVFHDPNRKIGQRGRVHIVVLHDNLYLAK